METSIFSGNIRYTPGGILCVVFICFCSLCSYGQTGNTFQTPIVSGPYSSPFQYSHLQNTANFTNNYEGRPTNDVFYKFTLTIPMEITVSHCGSPLNDTYLHLLDASGTRIAYNDDFWGECSNYYHSYLKTILGTGTYYVVSEGYSQSGEILTLISGRDIPGNSFQNPLVVPVATPSFQYSNSQNTSYFTNAYTGRPVNDVYYKFTLTTPMKVTISHCGSSLSDTYLHLLDASGTRIAYNDDYYGEGACSLGLHSCLETVLGAGTYYAVSEGYSQNGVIVTAIEAKSTRVVYAYDESGNRIGRQWVNADNQLRSSQEETPKKDRQVNPNPLKGDEETDSRIIDVATPDNSGETGTGIRIHVFPNPTHGPVNVEIIAYDDQPAGEIFVYDSDGRLMLRQKISSALTNINLTAYPRGTYLLQVQLDGETVAHKIVKNK